jgi:(E)-4-hydroxy-3-methylbut-2-enyl-diphosphate synthase
MCSTPTCDVRKTVGQILRLEKAGCDIVRVAVPDKEAAFALGRIKEKIHILWWPIFILITVWHLRP